MYSVGNRTGAGAAYADVDGHAEGHAHAHVHGNWCRHDAGRPQYCNILRPFSNRTKPIDCILLDRFPGNWAISIVGRVSWPRWLLIGLSIVSMVVANSVRCQWVRNCCSVAVIASVGVSIADNVVQWLDRCLIEATISPNLHLMSDRRISFCLDRRL